jgi:hypothetical protein
VESDSKPQSGPPQEPDSDFDADPKQSETKAAEKREWHFRRENGHWYSWSTEQNVTSH